MEAGSGTKLPFQDNFLGQSVGSPSPVPGGRDFAECGSGHWNRSRADGSNWWKDTGGGRWLQAFGFLGHGGV